MNHLLQVTIPRHLYEEVFFIANALGLSVEEGARVLIATGCTAIRGTRLARDLEGVDPAVAPSGEAA